MKKITVFFVLLGLTLSSASEPDGVAMEDARMIRFAQALDRLCAVSDSNAGARFGELVNISNEKARYIALIWFHKDRMATEDYKDEFLEKSVGRAMEEFGSESLPRDVEDRILKQVEMVRDSFLVDHLEKIEEMIEAAIKKA